ncbi:hypothetical protein BU25DRAFT_259338 [Macroventuria anomochaeta]|uniref:Uncharacterized protein n=1 Tax=Macroventuria anomochaeta TaxID=301207 RepID=A0ACB6S903_9PLEO|nr:uncharacterized protein BU25DRAFT_259338 [Macroventuria anomochaeta]KAF2630513.1 hypothetical protein BU25DRAFT_259338 [Macroventuria anomochaeta]
MNILLLSSSIFTSLILVTDNTNIRATQHLTDLCSHETAAGHRKIFLAGPINIRHFHTMRQSALRNTPSDVILPNEQSRKRAQTLKRVERATRSLVEPGAVGGVCCDTRLSRYEAGSCGSCALAGMSKSNSWLVHCLGDG